MSHFPHVRSTFIVALHHKVFMIRADYRGSIMTDRIFADVMTILVGIVGLAIIAVIVGKNAKTADVLKSGGTAFANIIKEAVSPVM